MATFDIVLRTEGSLHPGGEPDRFVSEHAGFITCTRDRDGRVANVGLVKAYRVQAALAREAGEPIFDVCDAHSRQTHDLYAALYDSETDDLKEDVRARFDVFDA